MKAFSSALYISIGVRHSGRKAAAIMKTPINPTMMPQCCTMIVYSCMKGSFAIVCEAHTGQKA